jgi:hypothetical protein
MNCSKLPSTIQKSSTLICRITPTVTTSPHRLGLKNVTAAIFWLKNRDPQHWRDSQQLEHVLGKYLISDQPMTEEQWARERATVIDDEPPRFGDGREENVLAANV